VLVSSTSCRPEGSSRSVDAEPGTFERSATSVWRPFGRTARVVLPAVGRGEASLEDEGSGLRLAFHLLGAYDTSASIEGDVARYPGGGPDWSDLSFRHTAEGIEDFVVFARKPPREELVYDVDVARARGLLLVANVLELLDDEGAPRLRVAS